MASDAGSIPAASTTIRMSENALFKAFFHARIQLLSATLTVV